MSDEAQKEREMLIEIARLNVMYEKAQHQVTQQVEELTALRKHSVKQVELVTQQAATIKSLTIALQDIHRESSNRRRVAIAEAALASLPREKP